jgi:hypothetical protein
LTFLAIEFTPETAVQHHCSSSSDRFGQLSQIGDRIEWRRI